MTSVTFLPHLRSHVFFSFHHLSPSDCSCHHFIFCDYHRLFLVMCHFVAFQFRSGFSSARRDSKWPFLAIVPTVIASRRVYLGIYSFFCLNQSAFFLPPVMSPDSSSNFSPEARLRNISFITWATRGQKKNLVGERNYKKTSWASHVWWEVCFTSIYAGALRIYAFASLSFCGSFGKIW